MAFAMLAQQPSDRCRIEGTVSNRVTGQPVRKAHIVLKPAKGDGSIDATTDSHGRFALADVQPGTYILTAEHDGYMTQRYGAKRPGEDQSGERLELAAGVVRNAVDLRMTPLGSIMGVVRDEDGDPVREVQVSAIEYRYGPEGRRLHVSTTTETDASGEFRIFDLPAGTYYLEAKRAYVSKTRAVEAYATTYFSGASQFSAATPLVLAAGQDVRGADFVLRTGAVSSLRGRIVAPEGSKCSIGLRDAQRQATVKRNAYTIRVDLGADAALDKDLRFEYSELPVGNHWLSARCKVNEQTYSTRMAVFLDAAGLNNLEVRPLAPSTLTGHVRIDGESTSKITDAEVTLRQQSDDPFLLFGSASDGDEGDGKVGDDGTFSFHGVFPGVFHVALHPPAGLYVKSIALDGRDVAETGVDVRAGGMSLQVEAVLSANGGSIEGWVENGAGATVTLIPTSPHSPAEPMRMAVGADGHFVLPVVAPGHYQLFAWQDADPDEALYSAEFRKPYEKQVADGRCDGEAEGDGPTTAHLDIGKVRRAAFYNGYLSTPADPLSLLAGFPIVTEITVLWGDQDAFGHVNNVAYLRWVETARVEYFRDIGLGAPLAPETIGPILATLTCHYRRPLNYPDTVVIGTRVTAIGNSSLRMEHKLISRAAGDIAAESDSVIVTVDYTTGRPVRVPDAVRQAVGKIEGREFV